MYEKSLNSLSKDERFEDTLIGSFEYKGANVSISLDPDGGEIEDTVTLAKRILHNLEAQEQKAIKKLIDEFFEDYNEDWRNDDEPVLSPEEFASNLKLNAISFLADELVDFFFEENGMFGHHSIIAQIFDGETFSDATMFG